MAAFLIWKAVVANGYTATHLHAYTMAVPWAPALEREGFAMADSTATPLSDEEREELEALRAEKARREEEERVRREREELEALRAEQDRVDAQILAERAAEHRAAARCAESAAPSAPAPEVDGGSDARKSFGERMVTSSSVDEDGIPTMPVAQKIILAAAFIALIVFVIYTVTR